MRDGQRANLFVVMRFHSVSVRIVYHWPNNKDVSVGWLCLFAEHGGYCQTNGRSPSDGVEEIAASDGPTRRGLCPFGRSRCRTGVVG